MIGVQKSALIVSGVFPKELPLLIQTSAIRSTFVIWVGKLYGIVLPVTHLANDERSRWFFVKGEIVTTRARKSADDCVKDTAD